MAAEQKISALLLGLVAAILLALPAKGFVTPLSTAALSGRQLGIRSQRNHHRAVVRPLCMKADAPEDDFEVTVDWDEELRKLNNKEVTGLKKTGMDGYSELELATMKVKSKVAKATRKPIRLPNPRNLARDWRFWLGIIAAISIITSILTATAGHQDLVVDTNTNAAHGDRGFGGGVTALLAATALAEQHVASLADGSYSGSYAGVEGVVESVMDVLA